MTEEEIAKVIVEKYDFDLGGASGNERAILVKDIPDIIKLITNDVAEKAISAVKSETYDGGSGGMINVGEVFDAIKSIKY